jgi:hypothetical protein
MWAARSRRVRNLCVQWVQLYLPFLVLLARVQIFGTDISFETIGPGFGPTMSGNGTSVSNDDGGGSTGGLGWTERLSVWS